MRYEIVKLKKARRGFNATIVDNDHPSGVKGLAVQWFETYDKAAAHLKSCGIVEFKTTEEK